MSFPRTPSSATAAAATVAILHDNEAQILLDDFNYRNMVNGFCPPVDATHFVPVSDIQSAEEYDRLIPEYRQRELFNFGAYPDLQHIPTEVDNYITPPGLYDKIMSTLRHSQKTAYTCIAYYQLSGKTWKNMNFDCSRLPPDPNDTYSPNGRLPGLVEVPTAGGKSWLIGAASVTKKTLIIVPNGTIRSGFRNVFERQFRTIGEFGKNISYVILDPNEKHDPKNGQMKRIEEDSDMLINKCDVLLTTYQALTDPETLNKMFAIFGRNSPIEQIIFDEGHHAAAITFRRIMKRAYALNPDLHVLLFTALIDRLDQLFIRHIVLYSMPLEWGRKTNVVADMRLNIIKYDVDGIVEVQNGGDKIDVQLVDKGKRRAEVPLDEEVAAGPSRFLGPYSGTSNDDGMDGMDDIETADERESKESWSPAENEDESSDGSEQSDLDESEEDLAKDVEALNVNDDQEDQEEEDRLTPEQKRIVRNHLYKNEAMQKYLIKQSLFTLTERAKTSRTFISILFACKDQDHAKDVLKWTKDVIRDDFVSVNPNWEKLLVPELIISEKETPLPLIGSEGVVKGTRKNAHERVQLGFSNIIVQVFMYSEGVDVVPVKIVTFLYPRSKHIAYQIIGRGLRMFWFNDPTHNGIWFNPDLTILHPSRMQWNRFFEGPTVTKFHQFDLMQDNIVDIIIPELFNMEDDIKSLDKTLSSKSIPFDKDGVSKSGEKRRGKKVKTGEPEILCSGAERKAVRDMEGNDVEGVETSAPLGQLAPTAIIDTSLPQLVNQLNGHIGGLSEGNARNILSSLANALNQFTTVQ